MLRVPPATRAQGSLPHCGGHQVQCSPCPGGLWALWRKGPPRARPSSRFLPEARFPLPQLRRSSGAFSQGGSRTRHFLCAGSLLELGVASPHEPENPNRGSSRSQGSWRLLQQPPRPVCQPFWPKPTAASPDPAALLAAPQCIGDAFSLYPEGIKSIKKEQNARVPFQSGVFV